MSDVLRAVEEAIERLAYMAQARAENASDRNDARSFHARATISLETLRAALAPVTDEEVERIRERHEELERLGELAHHDWASEAHTDRATLLRRDAQREAELAVERDRRTEVEAEVGRLREALKAMLAHSCVADAGADMKDEEDHAAERRARAALEPKA